MKNVHFLLFVTGDEILKGQTQDTNSHYMCQALHAAGVSVKKISVIGDVASTISSEVCMIFSEAIKSNHSNFKRK